MSSDLNAGQTIKDYGRSQIDSLCKVVCDIEIPFEKRLNGIKQYELLPLYCGYYDMLNITYSQLKSEAAKRKNNDDKLFCYSALAELNICSARKDAATAYLDTAETFTDRHISTSTLANYYRVKAMYYHKFTDYYNLDAVIFFQKALDEYSYFPIDSHPEALISILHSRIIGGIYRRDTFYIMKNHINLTALAKVYSSPLLDFAYNDAIAAKNSIMFGYSGDTTALNTSIFHIIKTIDAFRTNKLPHYLYNYCLDLHVICANLMCYKSQPDVALIDSLINYAEQHYNPNDTLALARITQTKAHFYQIRDMTDSAYITASQSGKYLASCYKKDKYSTLTQNIKLMKTLTLQRGDYQSAIIYADSITTLERDTQLNDIKEMLLQLEFEKKQSEYNALNDDLIYNHKLYNIYITICILLFIAIMLTIFSLKLKRNNLNRSVALMRKENEEIKLKLKLKEEQAVKSQLDKYETLSDFCLKEVELIGLQKDVEQLYREKAELDRQVEEYRKKIEDCEKELNVKQTATDIINVLIGDIIRLINIKMPDKTDLINNARLLKDDCAETLHEKCVDNISVSLIKYCLCFAIGMDSVAVAECFDLEVNSVHMIRYRLKKIFQLTNDDCLDDFLQEILLKKT
jgi:hypothetical protein